MSHEASQAIQGVAIFASLAAMVYFVTSCVLAPMTAFSGREQMQIECIKAKGNWHVINGCQFHDQRERR